MKIFNWVHRKFNNKAENVKRMGGEEQFEFGAENKCDDVFERWRGGILAIGTLGLDPLMDENEKLSDGYFFEDEEDDDHSSVKDDNGGDEDEQEQEQEEGNPLVLATYGCVAEEVTVTVTVTETETETEENLNQLQFGFDYMMMEKKERTTLADLFVADSGKDKQRAAVKGGKSDLVADKSSRRKLMTAKDARPIRKLNKLMRRMLRRKIHPDVGPTNPKVAATNNNNNNYDYDNNHHYTKCRATDDCALLLPSKDTNI